MQDDGSSGQALRIFRLRETDPDPAANAPAAEDSPLPVASFVPEGNLESLPASVTISTEPAYSSIWQLRRQKETTSLGEERRYVAVRFRPDGSTDLAESSAWYLTLAKHPQPNSEELPKNFFTIQIDPVTGALDYYRPE